MQKCTVLSPLPLVSFFFYSSSGIYIRIISDILLFSFFTIMHHMCGASLMHCTSLNLINHVCYFPPLIMVPHSDTGYGLCRYQQLNLKFVCLVKMLAQPSLQGSIIHVRPERSGTILASVIMLSFNNVLKKGYFGFWSTTDFFFLES